MKKNWFLTVNDQIVDLNMFIRFDLEIRGDDEHGKDCDVIGFITMDCVGIILGSFSEEEQAKEYLFKVFKQLMDYQIFHFEENNES